MIVRSFLASAAMLSALAIAPAQAGKADSYVKNLVGKWRGGGTVTINENGKRLKLRCSSTNRLNKSRRRLTMSGRCASASGTRSMRGSISYSADGSKITSVSMRFAGRGGSSSGRLRGNTLTVSGSGIDERTKKTVKGRSIIKGGGRSYSVTIQSNPGSGWKTNGTLRFRR